MQEPNQRMGFCVAGSSVLKHCLQGRREAYNAPENADKTQKGQEINTTYKAQKAAGDSRIHKVPLQGHCLSYVSAAVKKKIKTTTTKTTVWKRVFNFIISEG